MSGRDSIRQAVREHPLSRDVLLAVVLLAAELLMWFLSPHGAWPRSWVVGVSWLAVGMSTVALRRVFPWWAVAILSAHTAIPFLVRPATDLRSASTAIIIVTYTAAAYLPVRQAIAATVAIWVPGVGLALTGDALDRGSLPIPAIYFVAGNVMLAVVCFFVGRTVWNRRAYVASIEERARTDETTQRALTAQAVADERRRIARELHDVVAHHVSVMGVLAAGSRRTLARDPAAADEALATIEETGRSALREMRRLLNVLRTDDSEPAGELTPQPGLAGLAGLVEQVREAGLPTKLHIEGEPAALDPGVALTVYRIVQEALTNALKHAGAATVEVRLTFGASFLIVEVCDTGRGPRADATPIGHGLLGMRERVSLYGGSLRTGPRTGGGYRVYAKILLDGSTAGPGIREMSA